MKRKYNSKMAMEAIELLRKSIPNVKFSTDVIVGFPNEDNSDIAASADFLEKAGFLTVHIFPYSKRKGTLAAQMGGQLSGEIKRERLHRLEAIAKKTRENILKEEITRRPVREVLFETFDGIYAYGHTDDFLEIAVLSQKSLRSETMTVKLLSTDGNICFGELV